MLLIEFCVMTLCESRSLAIISLLLTRYAGNGAIELRRRNLSLSKGIFQVRHKDHKHTHTLGLVRVLMVLHWINPLQTALRWSADRELVRKLSIYRTVKFTWTRCRGRWCVRDQVPTRTDHHFRLQTLRRFEWLVILWAGLKAFKYSSNLVGKQFFGSSFRFS